MQRTEEKGWVTLDWTEELEALREKIEDILALYNPTHPVTIGMISWNVGELIRKVNEAWQGELTYKNTQVTDQMSRTLTQGIITMLEKVTEGE